MDLELGGFLFDCLFAFLSNYCFQSEERTLMITTAARQGHVISLQVDQMEKSSKGTLELRL